jgi:hypothetical protein
MKPEAALALMDIIQGLQLAISHCAGLSARGDDNEKEVIASSFESCADISVTHAPNAHGSSACLLQIAQRIRGSGINPDWERALMNLGKLLLE